MRWSDQTLLIYHAKRNRSSTICGSYLFPALHRKVLLLMTRDALPRAALLSLVAICVCWAFLYYPWLSGHFVMPYDAIDENYPTLFFTSQSLRHGQLPWWNPYIFTGFPQIADPQALIFSPLVTGLMAAVANPTPHWLDIIVMLHILLCGIGMFGFLRRLGLSYPASIFGAVIAMGGGCAPARLEHTALLIGTSTLPWVGWALLALCQKPSLKNGLALGVATGWMGLVLVQTTYIALLLIALALLASIAFRRHAGAHLARMAVPLLVAGLITVLICGTQVAALLTFLPETVRSHLPLSASMDNSAPLQELWTFFWPNAMNTFSPAYTGPIDITESIIYCGILTAITFVIGLSILATGGHASRTSLTDKADSPSPYWLLAFLLAFTVLYALGTNTPFYGLLYHIVPGISLFRRPVDAMFLVTLFVCPIAALGFDRVLSWLRRPLLSKPLVTAVAGLAIIGLCWDLTSHTLAPNRANSWPAATVASLPDKFQSAAFLRSNTRNPGQPNWRVAFNQPAPFWPDLPAVVKVYSTQGYNPLQNARYVGIFGVTPNGYSPIVFTKWVTGYQSPLFSLLGVKYIASATGSTATHLAQNANLKLAFSGDGMNIWETQNRLPRLFSPTETIAATTADAAEATSLVKDLSKSAVIEAEPERLATCGTQPLQKIQLVKYHNNDVYIHSVTGDSSGWLVMTDPATDGWHAYVDGKETTLFRADGFMRAVCVPAGTHDVSFHFEPFRQIAATFLKLLPH